MSTDPFAAEAVPAEAMPVEAAPATGVQAKLICKRGRKPGVEYPIYEGENYIGRSDEQPVDVDLDDQENPEQVWSSRQHAVIRLSGGQATIEDLKSSNGTYVNRVKINPGEQVPLNNGDMVQIGTIHLQYQA